MKIALDYDHTYSLDPIFWNQVIRAARRTGHDIRVVTARDDRLDRTAQLVELEKRLPVIYTRGIAKKWFCTHFGEGFVPDVWIDDRPESVIDNSDSSVESLADWRWARNEGPTLEI